MTPPPTPPVGDPTQLDEEWRELAAELAPAKSLQRLDAAATRVVSTVSLVATLLTGLGLVAAGLTNLTTFARLLAMGAVVLAFVAALLALRAQTLGIIHGLNRENLAEVEDWYLTRFEKRAPRLRRATYLLVGATALAGAAALWTLAFSTDPPTLAVTRTSIPTPGKLTVDVTFRGLDDGESVSAVVRVDGAVAAEAIVGPGPDGTASRTLTVEQVPAAGVVTVEARAGDQTCTATLTPGTAAEVRCPGD